MEEALKMRNLLQEFLTEHGVRHPSILGVREHIFTGRLVTWKMDIDEFFLQSDNYFIFNYAVYLPLRGLCQIRSTVL